MQAARQLKRGMIVAGSRISDGVIVTIPADSMFNGQVFLSASITTEGAARPSVSVVGSDCDPSGGTIVHQLSLAGVANAVVTSSGVVDVLVKTGSAAATLNISLAGASSASASVNGFLV